jgi:hypothetical protein
MPTNNRNTHNSLNVNKIFKMIALLSLQIGSTSAKFLRSVKNQPTLPKGFENYTLASSTTITCDGQPGFPPLDSVTCDQTIFANSNHQTIFLPLLAKNKSELVRITNGHATANVTVAPGKEDTIDFQATLNNTDLTLKDPEFSLYMGPKGFGKYTCTGTCLFNSKQTTNLENTDRGQNNPRSFGLKNR